MLRFDAVSVFATTYPCVDGPAAFGEQLGTRRPANFASQYDLKPLYAKGAKGQGQTIGIITYASVRPADAEHFWSKVLKISTKQNQITLDKIDGGSGPVRLRLGSNESSLDVEQSGALAPRASIVVYEAPNTDAGYADSFFAPASQDKATADAACATLEANDIRCWIAPRDVLPGKNWAASIIEALHTARVVVLVFSENANHSSQVARELERAANLELPIVPFRIQNVLPSEAMEYFLGSPHWLDALTPPLEAHLQRLDDVREQHQVRQR